MDNELTGRDELRIEKQTYAYTEEEKSAVL